MTEAAARHLLHDWSGFGGLEAWMARQPWETVAGGWAVKPDLQGWRFQLEPVSDGLRISALMSGALPAVWIVTD